MSAFARLPLAFEPLRGGGAFVARGAGSGVLLRARDVSFALGREQRRALVRMELARARSQARLAASKRLPGVVNEFLGSDPARWRTNVPTFARLLARGVYPRIDVAYQGSRARSPITADSGGSAYVTGETSSTNFPTANAFQAANGGPGPLAMVALRAFAAARSGRTVLLRWRTRSEAGLLGFDLYRRTRRLNRTPSARRLAGGSYSFRDRLPGGVRSAR